MSRTLLWDAGPGEIRSGLIENNHLVEFRIIRLRRAESALYQAGEIYTARLKEKINPNLGLVILGGDQLAIIQPCPAIAEGALLEVEMLRGPIPEPGNWKLPKVRALATPPRHKEPAWQFSAEPWELFLQAQAKNVDTILCPNVQTVGEVKSLLGSTAPDIICDADKISAADFDSTIDSAVSGTFSIPGGTLHIERTRAMTMIDVDGTIPARALNLFAASEIPRLLRLLDIGGPIGIDFVATANREERIAIAAALDAAAQNLGAFERTAINGYGFCQIIRPRTGPSIPEILCGTGTAQLSTESRAIALLRTAGRSIGVGPRQLVAPPALIELIRAWPEETAALQFSLGVAIELLPDPTASPYGHVHVKPA
jgi:ribonuclease G